MQGVVEMTSTTHVTSLPSDHPVGAAQLAQPVLSIRGRVEESAVPSFIQHALHEIRVHIENSRVEVQGAPFTICRPAGPHRVDVEAGWPVSHATSSGRITAGTLPMGLVRRGPDAGEPDQGHVPDVPVTFN